MAFRIAKKDDRSHELGKVIPVRANTVDSSKAINKGKVVKKLKGIQGEFKEYYTKAVLEEKKILFDYISKVIQKINNEGLIFAGKKIINDYKKAGNNMKSLKDISSTARKYIIQASSVMSDKSEYYEPFNNSIA